MVENSTNRRDVLKSIGVTSSLSLVAPSSAEAVDTDFGKKRLIEVGLEYEVPDYNYHGTKHGGSPTYFIDESAGEMILYPMLPHRARILERNDSIVGGQRINEIPSRMGGKSTTSVVIEMSGYRRPVRSISLREPHNPPEIEIQRANNNPMITVPGSEIELSPGQSESVELGTETLVATKQRLTGERAEIEGMPDHRIGFKRKREPITIEATPVVKAKDYGELEVKQLKP